MAGTSPTGPWTDGRTGVRSPDDDERHPWRIPLDRPCRLCYLVQKWFKPDMTLPLGGGRGCRTHKTSKTLSLAHYPKALVKDWLPLSSKHVGLQRTTPWIGGHGHNPGQDRCGGSIKKGIDTQ